MIERGTMMQAPQASKTAFVLVDFQEKLVAAMEPALCARAQQNALRFLQAASHLGVRVLATEQYRKGLGPTTEALRACLPRPAVDKRVFDCTRADGLAAELSNISDVVLMGMETHVCILQSVMGAQALGLRPWVAFDAVCSRTHENFENGLKLCERAGAIVASTEAILFLLLGGADAPAFSAVSKLIR